jgi:hypothetical protein
LHDGTDEQFVEIADNLSLRIAGQGLDSLDIGDAMGAMIAFAESEEWSHDDSGNYVIDENGVHITITVDYPFFEWSTPDPDYGA